MRNAVVSLFVVLVLAAPCISAETTTEPIRLVFAPARNAMDIAAAQIERFHQLYPDIQVEISSATGSGTGEKRAEKFMLLSVAGSAPDVAEIYPQVTGRVIQSGIVLPWDPFIADDPAMKLDKFVPGAYQCYMYQGQTYGMLSALSIIPLYVNNALLQLAGLTHPSQLGDNWTWEEFFQYARKLTQTTADGRVSQWGLAVSPILQRWAIHIHQAGGGITDHPADPTRSLWNSPEVAQGLGFILSLYEAGVVKSGKLLDRNVGMDMGSTSEIMAQLRQTDIDWGIVDWPRGPKHNALVVSGEGYLLSAGTKYPEAAWKLVRFLLTDPEAVRMRIAHLVRPPSYLPEMNQFRAGVLPKGVPAYVVDVIRKAASHPNVGAVPSFPQFGDIQTRFNSIFVNEVVPKKRPLSHLLEEMHQMTIQALQR